MCFCERDVVNILIHSKARRLFPGIKFHEGAAGKVATQFGIDNTLKLREMSAADVKALAEALLRALPPECLPPKERRQSARA